MEPIILSDNSLNRNGYRVITSGIDLSAFRKNSVMLYDHRRYSMKPIGRWKNIKKDGEKLTAVPEFTTKTKDGQEVAGLFEDKTLNAASMGFRVLETSNDPKDMLPGQRFPTVTKCLLLEASIVPIPGNGNAVRLYAEDGKELDLADEEALSLALAPNNFNMSKDSDPEKRENEAIEKQGNILKTLSDNLAKILQKDKGEDAPAPSTDPPPAEKQADPPTALSILTENVEKLTGIVEKLAARMDKSEEEVKKAGDTTQLFLTELKKLADQPAAEDTDTNSQKDQKSEESAKKKTLSAFPETELAIAQYEQLKEEGGSHD